MVHVRVKIDEDRLCEADKFEGDLEGDRDEVVEENDEGEKVVGEVLAVVCEDEKFKS